MTPEELAEIEKRAEEATPGPWRWLEDAANADMRAHGTRANSRDQYILLLRGPDSYHRPGARIDTIENRVLALRWRDMKGTTFIGAPCPTDCAFIAAARADVPALCDALREAWARIDQLTKSAERS